METNTFPKTSRLNIACFLEGFKAGIPIALGYFAVAVAVGIQAKGVGMNALQAGAMSAGMLASAGEKAALDLIGGGAGAAEMIFTTIIVNLRYLLMGASLSQKIEEKTKLPHRFLLSYFITDELFGISSAVEGKLNPFYTYGAGIIAAAGWTAGTVFGVLIGSVLPLRLVDALSVALYGMFLAVIIPASRKDRFIALLVFIAMASSWLFSMLPGLKNISSGFRVIILTVLIAGGAAFINPLQSADEKESQR